MIPILLPMTNLYCPFHLVSELLSQPHLTCYCSGQVLGLFCTCTCSGCSKNNLTIKLVSNMSPPKIYTCTCTYKHNDPTEPMTKLCVWHKTTPAPRQQWFHRVLKLKPLHRKCDLSWSNVLGTPSHYRLLLVAVIFLHV